MVGCAVTHLRGWNASAGHDAAAPWQLFSEDDVVLEAGAAQRLVAAVEAAERRSPDWHVVFFAPTVPEHELAGLLAASCAVKLGSRASTSSWAARAALRASFWKNWIMRTRWR